MNCYEVQNPTNGQKCYDDVLGQVVYNQSDDTWEKQTGYTKGTNGFYFNLDSLKYASSDEIPKTVLEKYGVYFVAAGVFVVMLIVLSLATKKK